MRSVSVLAFATIAAAACGLVLATPVIAHPGKSGCRVFADIPRPPAKPAARAQLFAWGEVHCSARTDVSVRVCALNVGSGPIAPPEKPIWCQQSSITALPGKPSFARTRPHVCTVGSHYVSIVELNGLAIDRGPWNVCRFVP